MRRIGVVLTILLLGALISAVAAPADDSLTVKETKIILKRDVLPAEAAAEAALKKQDWKTAREQAYRAAGGLGWMFGNIHEANGLAAGEVAEISAIMKSAIAHDNAAADAAKNKNAKRARSELAKAAVDKRHLAALLEDVAPGEQCETSKDFTVYAVPAGYDASYVEVTPHGVPRNAKNISLIFYNREGTPIRPGGTLFRGQTWQATTQGFTGDGRLRVRIDVTGPGFGAPDAVKSSMRVRVLWDC